MATVNEYDKMYNGSISYFQADAYCRKDQLLTELPCVTIEEKLKRR